MVRVTTLACHFLPFLKGGLSREFASRGSRRRNGGPMQWATRPARQEGERSEGAVRWLILVRCLDEALSHCDRNAPSLRSPPSLKGRVPTALGHRFARGRHAARNPRYTPIYQREKRFPHHSAACVAYASIGGHAQTRLRSPYTLSTRATGDQYLRALSDSMGNAACSRV